MAVIRTVTIAPGENTGWHYHPAPVQAVVLSGTLTRVLADGSVEITRPGEPLVEQAGPDQVHIGLNHGTEPVVILANFQVVEGCPFSIPAPATARGLAQLPAGTNEHGGNGLRLNDGTPDGSGLYDSVLGGSVLGGSGSDGAGPGAEAHLVGRIPKPL